MASANVCGNSYVCFLSEFVTGTLVGNDCIGLYDISHKAARAAFAAAFFASFFDGPNETFLIII